MSEQAWDPGPWCGGSNVEAIETLMRTWRQRMGLREPKPWFDAVKAPVFFGPLERPFNFPTSATHRFI